MTRTPTLLCVVLAIGSTSAADEPVRVNPAEQWCIVGDVWVRLEAKVVADTEQMLIFLTVKTDNKTRKIEYRSWRKAPLLGRNDITIVDNHKNTYKQVQLSIDATTALEAGIAEQARRIKASVGSGPVSEGSPRLDFVFVEKPISGADYLDIDLTGANVGEQEPFRFRLLKKNWLPPPLPEPAPKPEPMPPPVAKKPAPKSKPAPVKREFGPVEPPKGPTVTLKPLAKQPIPLAKDGEYLTAFLTARDKQDDATTQRLVKTGNVTLLTEPLPVVVVSRLKLGTIVWVVDGPNAGKTYTVPNLDVPSQ